MSNYESSQAFTHFVINQIKPEVIRSLTKKQLQEIKSAISASTPLKRHSIDIRGVLPLFFTRLYFVLMIGRDKRHKSIKIELMRRRDSDILANILFFIVFLIPIFFLLFLALYFLKSELGIDFFSDEHLIDLIKY
ncbi:MAG: hypothetical protein QM504_00575 [Pseudomonadota bacterium]